MLNHRGSDLDTSCKYKITLCYRKKRFICRKKGVHKLVLGFCNLRSRCLAKHAEIFPIMIWTEIQYTSASAPCLDEWTLHWVNYGWLGQTREWWWMESNPVGQNSQMLLSRAQYWGQFCSISLPVTWLSVSSVSL